MKKYFLALFAALIQCSIVFSGSLNNPSGGISPGIAVGQSPSFDTASYNALNFSEQFDSIFWSNVGTTVTINSIVAPNGTMRGALITSSCQGCSIFNDGNLNSNDLANNKYVSGSVYISAGNSTSVRVQLIGQNIADTASYVEFNPKNGNITTQSGLTLLQSITVLGVNWWRVGLTELLTGPVGPVRLSIFPTMVNNPNETTTYIWGAQVEPGKISTGYIYTNSLGSAANGYGMRFAGRLSASQLTLAPITTPLNSATTTLNVNDVGKTFISAAAGNTIILPDRLTLSDGWFVDFVNGSSQNNTLTIDPTASGAIKVITPARIFAVGNPNVITLPYNGASFTGGEYNAVGYRVMLTNNERDWIVTSLGANHGQQKFTANGTFTVGTQSTLWISGCGGGGGGGGSLTAGSAGGATTFSPAGALVTLNGGLGGPTSFGPVNGGSGGNGISGYPATSLGLGTVMSMAGGSPWGQGGIGRAGTGGSVNPVGYCSGGIPGQTNGSPGSGGEYVIKIPVSVNANTTYTIIIGAGGAAGTDATAAPTNGLGGLLLIEW